MEQATITRTESVSIADLSIHPKNARRGNTAAIEKSLRDHGQYAPIVVHEGTGHVLKGNHTFRVLRDKLGASHVLATFVRCSEAKALAILAVDNKTSDGAGYDQESLLALLEELNDADMLAAAGFRDAELDALLAKMEEQYDTETEEPESLLGSGLGVDPDTPASQEVRADGVAPPETLTERAEEHEQPSSRMLILTFPAEQYAYALERLTVLGEKLGFDNHADLFLKILADRTGVPVPAGNTPNTSPSATAR